MTKHYCDRCGKETHIVRKERIPNTDLRNGDYEVAEVELCNECDRELQNFKKALLPAIANLKVTMYKNFMNK